MSDLLDIANEMAQALFKAGPMDEITMREVESLPPRRPFRPEDIRRIRTSNHVSQAVFATFLGTGKTTVQQWERGDKKPSGPAQRLLYLIDRKGLAAPG